MQLHTHTIWVTEGDWDEAWLAAAWDEYSVENNNEGWCEKRDELRVEYGESLKIVLIDAPEEQIEAAFAAPVVTGKCEVE